MYCSDRGQCQRSGYTLNALAEHFSFRSKLNSQKHIVGVFIKSVGVVRKYITVNEGSVKEVGIP